MLRRSPEGQRRSVAAATRGRAHLAALVLGLAAGVHRPRCAAARSRCQCGDTVGSDYSMTADLGPCPRLGGGADTVGLQAALRRHPRLPGPQHHGTRRSSERLVRDPGGDGLRSEQHDGEALQRVGILVGRATWIAASDVLIESNHLHDNGWKVAGGERQRLRPRRRQLVGRDRQEQSHRRQRQRGLSPLRLLPTSSWKTTSSSDNGPGAALSDPRRQQRDPGEPGDGWHSGARRCGFRARTRSPTTCGRASPLQFLENDNNDNTFFYERFEGRVAVGDAYTGNRFELSSFSNPAGNCMTVASPEHRVRLQELLRVVQQSR